MACQLTVRRKLRCEKRCGLHLLLFSIEISIRRGANCLFRSHLHFSLSLCAVLIRPFCPDVYKIMVKERALHVKHSLSSDHLVRARPRKKVFVWRLLPIGCQKRHGHFHIRAHTLIIMRCAHLLRYKRTPRLYIYMARRARNMEAPLQRHARSQTNKLLLLILSAIAASSIRDFFGSVQNNLFSKA